MGRMSYKTPGPVSGYFLASLQESALPWGLYLTERLFRMRVDWACEFLDLAHETVGEGAAMAMANTILDRFTGDESAAADLRLMRMEAERFLLATQPPPGLGDLG